MRVFGLWAVLLWGAAIPATAQQAMSVSMIECAVIYDEMTGIGTAATATEERRATLREWSDAFAKAALVQAIAEGEDDPHSHIRTQTRKLEQKWQGRLGRLSEFGENKDWLDYCRKFGKAKGILLR